MRLPDRPIKETILNHAKREKQIKNFKCLFFSFIPSGIFHAGKRNTYSTCKA